MLLVSDAPPVPFGHGGGVIAYHQARLLEKIDMLDGILTTKPDLVESHFAVPIYDISPEKIGLPPGPWSLDYRIARHLADEDMMQSIFFNGAGYPLTASAIQAPNIAVADLPAHNIEESVAEFKRFGYEFPYKHLTDPALLKLYVKHLLGSQLIFCPAQMCADYAVEKFGLQKDRIKVVPRGTTMPGKNHSRPTIRDINALHISQFGPDKGQVDLMAGFAFALQQHPNKLHLEIAGAGTGAIPTAIRFNTELQEVLKDSVKYWDYVKEWELRQLYMRTTLYLHSSITEAFGLTILDAMSYGIPVISTNGAGASELIKDGQNGFVVPIRDPGKIAEKIVYFIDNPSELTRMGKEAAITASQYTWDRWESETQKALEEVLG